MCCFLCRPKDILFVVLILLAVPVHAAVPLCVSEADVFKELAALGYDFSDPHQLHIALTISEKQLDSTTRGYDIQSTFRIDQELERVHVTINETECISAASMIALLGLESTERLKARVLKREDKVVWRPSGYVLIQSGRWQNLNTARSPILFEVGGELGIPGPFDIGVGLNIRTEVIYPLSPGNIQERAFGGRIIPTLKLTSYRPRMHKHYGWDIRLPFRVQRTALQATDFDDNNTTETTHYFTGAELRYWLSDQWALSLGAEVNVNATRIFTEESPDEETNLRQGVYLNLQFAI